MDGEDHVCAVLVLVLVDQLVDHFVIRITSGYCWILQHSLHLPYILYHPHRLYIVGDKLPSISLQQTEQDNKHK